MTYQLRNDELLATALKRVAGEQLAASISDLESGKVYEVRKAMKRLRALLCLIKSELGPAFAEENRRLRAVGQRFSAQRDADVSLEVLEQFAEQYKRKRTLDPQRRVLLSKRQVAEVREAVEDLAAALKRVDDWSLHGLTRDQLEQRLERTHKQGRRAFQHACETGVAEDFHEFRKLVKREFNQVKLLRPEDPILPELKKLGDYLGDHHNLTVLLANVGHTSRRFGLMVRKQGRLLEQQAIALASTLYQKTLLSAETKSAIYSLSGHEQKRIPEDVRRATNRQHAIPPGRGTSPN